MNEKTKIGRNAPCPCGSGKKFKRCGCGRQSAPVYKKPDYEAHAINEDGVLMEDMIMCAVLGLKEIPKGYHVKHRNGNTLDNCRSNLELMND
jgi:hypothetical protein